jgi:hypothetical protein
MENQKKQPQRSAGEGDVVIKEAMSLENVREALNEEQATMLPSQRLPGAIGWTRRHARCSASVALCARWRNITSITRS